ncbi:MAG: hypothetical protein K9M54_00220 [Kiritimatiellales bacterium]|nr:hypothetical protein [Kiritimatiellales bacterium]MCF7864673.1 hypothetical protein [Kiritimatiellales bacterium]
MKKHVPLIIAVFSILIALAASSTAVKATRQKRLAVYENAALRQQIAELKTRTSRRRTSPTEQARNIPSNPDNTNALVTLQSIAGEDAQPPDRPPRETFEERIARMKAEEPEGYAEMVKRREERQQAMKYDMATRAATIMDIDTTKMNDTERAAHDQLVLQMGSIWELMAQVQNPEGGANRETMGELFNQIRDARPLMDQERATMFRVLGSEMGYEGQAAQDFATQIESIISATTIQMPRGGGPGGSGGRGGPGGGRQPE